MHFVLQMTRADDMLEDERVVTYEQLKNKQKEKHTSNKCDVGRES